MAEPRFDTGFVMDSHPNEGMNPNLKLAERIYWDSVGPQLNESIKRSNRFDRYYHLRMDADESGINPDEPTNIEYKKLALRTIMGYNSLRGFKSLDEAPDNAVVSAFKKAYYRK